MVCSTSWWYFLIPSHKNPLNQGICFLLYLKKWTYYLILGFGGPHLTILGSHSQVSVWVTSDNVFDIMQCWGLNPGLLQAKNVSQALNYLSPPNERLYFELETLYWRWHAVLPWFFLYICICGTELYSILYEHVMSSVFYVAITHI